MRRAGGVNLVGLKRSVPSLFQFGEIEGLLNARENITVLVDEAHRTREGKLGIRMHAALPTAFFFGLTGTSINRRDSNTFATFGAVEDAHGYMSRFSCVLSTPWPGLAIACREGFVDGLPAFWDDWELIEVSAKDAEEKLATNVLVLDAKTDLAAAESPKVAEALAKAGQEVITTPFWAVFLWGGAFRCWHHPLVRDNGRA